MEKKEIVRFPGMFQWWSYTVGHGQLLLRRTKNDSFRTRIDILFTDVDTVQLAAILTDPIIEQIDPSGIPRSAFSSVEVGERNAYRLRAGEFEGYVVAGTVAWHEDEMEYDESSALIPTR